MQKSISISKASSSKINEIDFNNIPFGKVFTDHMFVVDYSNGQWHDPRILPLDHIPVHPGNLAWHYGQAIFEGMKASRDNTGEPLLFRPEMHAKRMNNSARRMSMPELPEDLFVAAVHTLVHLEQSWIPPQKGSALYIRPFMVAMDETIGVRASETYKFIIFTMPVGPYYNQPVKLWAQDKYIRAVVGGVGEAKTAGNYAASLLPATIARSHGYDQVMWLDGIHKKYIQEVGTMNIFFVIGDQVLTPRLDGAILPGITRDSIIALLAHQGKTVVEKDISIDEIIEAYSNGQLKEVFGSGTAAVIAPVAEIAYNDTKIILNPENYTVATAIKNTINDMRDKSIADPFGWIIPAQDMHAYA